MRFGLLSLLLIYSCGTGRFTSAEAQQTAGMAISPGVQKAWAATYIYADAAGEAPAGNPVFVAYRLRIPRRAGMPVTLTIRGFQADEAMRCGIVGNARRVEVHFLSYANGHSTNRYGVAVYAADALLFVLERSEDSDGMVTEWKALKPDGVSVEQGKFFRAVRGTGQSAPR